ncbi:hypothetical protein TNCV_1855471 [Trichonephila clavipes]|nr:hypothetical protein TNCV_1855471 [Trichonephila clavipes]
MSEIVRQTGFSRSSMSRVYQEYMDSEQKTSDRANCKGHLDLIVRDQRRLRPNIWQVIPVELENSRKLVEFIPRRVTAVIKARGGPTRYCIETKLKGPSKSRLHHVKVVAVRRPSCIVVSDADCYVVGPSRRAASPPVRFVEEEEKQETLDYPRVFSLTIRVESSQSNCDPNSAQTA